MPAAMTSAVFFLGSRFGGKAQATGCHGIHGERRENIHSVAVGKQLVSRSGFVVDGGFCVRRKTDGCQSIGNGGALCQRYRF